MELEDVSAQATESNPPPATSEGEAPEGHAGVETAPRLTSQNGQSRKRSRSPSPRPAAADRTSTADDTGPRKRARTAIDEKTRSRRLFGSLLGTAAPTRGARADRGPRRDGDGPPRTSTTTISTSTSTSTPADNDDATLLRRRTSIDRRKRAELAARDETILALQKTKLEELNRRRRERQRLLEEREREREWDERILRSGHLRTKGAGGVYWTPWKLTAGQEKEVRERKELVRRQVEEERREWRRKREEQEQRRTTDDDDDDNERRRSTNGNGGGLPKADGVTADEAASRPGEEDDKRAIGETETMRSPPPNKGGKLDSVQDDDEKPRPAAVRSENEGPGTAQAELSSRSRSPSSEEDGDDGVDAGEDTVMY